MMQQNSQLIKHQANREDFSVYHLHLPVKGCNIRSINIAESDTVPATSAADQSFAIADEALEKSQRTWIPKGMNNTKLIDAKEI